MGSSLTKQYDQEIDRNRDKFAADVIHKWSRFPTPITKIPRTGYSLSQCQKLLNTFASATMSNIMGHNFSGTIYSNQIDSIKLSTAKIESIDQLYAECYRISYMWNSLHDNEFPIASYLEYCIVQMIANMIDGTPIEGLLPKINDPVSSVQIMGESNDPVSSVQIMGESNDPISSVKIMGKVTSGGTKSLMGMCRRYQNYGMMVKGLAPTECVIIAPKTIHASVMKAQQAYHFKLILIPITPAGVLDQKCLNEKCHRYRDNIVAFFCSAPCYPYGTVDDSELFSELATKYNAGLHIDACLGGFVTDPLKGKDGSKKLPSQVNFTSLSIDPHKNGLAPKGTGLLLTRDIGGRNLLYYGVYTVEDWMGGPYGTIDDEGSCSCVNLLATYFTLLATGMDTYESNAKKILDTANNIRTQLQSYSLLDVVRNRNEGSTAIVAFRFLTPGAVYKLYDIMKSDPQYPVHLNVLSEGYVHMCVTSRSLSVDNFISCFERAYTEVNRLIATGYKFDEGTAKLYCSIDIAFNPQKATTWSKYLENWLFGRSAIKDIIRYHFLTQNNPHYWSTQKEEK